MAVAADVSAAETIATAINRTERPPRTIDGTLQEKRPVYIAFSSCPPYSYSPYYVKLPTIRGGLKANPSRPRCLPDPARLRSVVPAPEDSVLRPA